MTRQYRQFGTRCVALAALLFVAACAQGRYGPSWPGKVTKPPRDLRHLTVDERLDVLRRAQVWQPIDTASLDLLAGPKGKGAFALDEEVVCDYVYPEAPLSGASPKFRCQLPGNDVVKVKYGRDNGEVYAEVAATRLLWALGFGADRMYPVRITCRNCPSDPWSASKSLWNRGYPRDLGERRFEFAVIERSFEGKPVEVPGFEGWAWPELEHVSEDAGGAPRAHVDALKLAAVLLQHTDSKPQQQQLACVGSVDKDADGNETCGTAFLILKDVGVTFNRAKRRNFGRKMELEGWQQAPMWREPEQCVANLKRSYTGSLRHPQISEAGRRFLAERLTLLGDEQLHDLFKSTRLDRRGAEIRDQNGGRRLVTVDDWVREFKRKRAEIVDHRCPA